MTRAIRGWQHYQEVGLGTLIILIINMIHQLIQIYS